MKMAVFWVVERYSPVEVYRRFRDTSYANCLGDGGRKHFLNVGEFLPNYTAQHYRRQPSLVLIMCRNGILRAVLCTNTDQIGKTMQMKSLDDVSMSFVSTFKALDMTVLCPQRSVTGPVPFFEAAILRRIHYSAQ
jgi:hypothetical protein